MTGLACLLPACSGSRRTDGAGAGAGGSCGSGVEPKGAVARQYGAYREQEGTAERALFEYVGKVTEAAYRTTHEDVQKLRDLGWTEPQIAEAVYITAMFAFFNRVADAFGIEPQNYLEMNQLTK